MSDQQAFEQLKDFFETRPVCRDAARPLGKNVEIGVVINQAVSCAFFKVDGNPRFEEREARNPDVIFYIAPDAVRSLVTHPNDDIGELGVNIAKSYLAGTIKIKVKGSLISLAAKGYFGVIKAGGFSFGKFLASHGVSGFGKIKEVIQSLRNNA